jgi:hypothetical protein
MLHMHDNLTRRSMALNDGHRLYPVRLGLSQNLKCVPLKSQQLSIRKSFVRHVLVLTFMVNIQTHKAYHIIRF